MRLLFTLMQMIYWHYKRQYTWRGTGRRVWRANIDERLTTATASPEPWRRRNYIGGLSAFQSGLRRDRFTVQLRIPFYYILSLTSVVLWTLLISLASAQPCIQSITSYFIQRLSIFLSDGYCCNSSSSQLSERISCVTFDSSRSD